VKENQRIRLSKKMLKDSFIKLLEKESIHKISVREICDEAQINRTTFYKYYGSPYDLLVEMENDVLTQIGINFDSDDDTFENSLKRITNIITFIDNNINLCKIIFNNNTDPEFPEKLMNLPYIKQITSQLTLKFGEDKLKYIFSFIIDGGFNFIRCWMNKENREAPEEIATLLDKIILNLFI
jgi:AcrR family transcriptional regulator